MKLSHRKILPSPHEKFPLQRFSDGKRNSFVSTASAPRLEAVLLSLGILVFNRMRWIGSWATTTPPAHVNNAMTQN